MFKKGPGMQMTGLIFYPAHIDPMAKVLYIDPVRIAFMCPGCGKMHQIPVSGRPEPDDHGWGFDGNMDCPTIDPSVRVQWTRMKDPHFVESQEYTDIVCHGIITQGEIHFCEDSTHELSGQTVSLPDL